MEWSGVCSQESEWQSQRNAKYAEAGAEGRKGCMTCYRRAMTTRLCMTDGLLADHTQPEKGGHRIAPRDFRRHRTGCGCYPAIALVKLCLAWPPTPVERPREALVKVVAREVQRDGKDRQQLLGQPLHGVCILRRSVTLLSLSKGIMRKLVCNMGAGGCGQTAGMEWCGFSLVN